MAAFAGVVLLCACSTVPELPPPDYNFGPEPAGFEPAIEDHFHSTLFDPFTAHIEYGRPYKAYELAPIIKGGGIAWRGWAVDVRVNAKNRLGAYVGWRVYHAEMVGNYVQEIFEASEPEVLFKPYRYVQELGSR